MAQQASGLADISATEIYTHIYDEEWGNDMKSFRNKGCGFEGICKYGLQALRKSRGSPRATLGLGFAFDVATNRLMAGQGETHGMPRAVARLIAAN